MHVLLILNHSSVKNILSEVTEQLLKHIFFQKYYILKSKLSNFIVFINKYIMCLNKKFEFFATLSLLH